MTTSHQFDLFAPSAPREADSSLIQTPPRPYRHGDVARLRHGLHLHRMAWYYWDASEPVWRCIDPFDTYGINYRDEPPVVNDCGRLVS